MINWEEYKDLLIRSYIHAIKSEFNKDPNQARIVVSVQIGNMYSSQGITISKKEFDVWCFNNDFNHLIGD